MHSPYTPQPLDALMIAQTSVGLVLTAVAWSRPSRPAASSCVLVAAVWWTVLLPIQQELLGSFGVHLSADNYHWSLRAQATLATIAMLLSGRPFPIAFAVVTQIGLSKLTDFLVGSDWELSCLHLVYFGALVGLQARARDDDIASTFEPNDQRSSFGAHDLRMFALAMLFGIGASIFVLEQSVDTSDEWAYTFQAAVFAKGRPFAPAPPCSPAFQNFWVFESMGRWFGQYTPGWPLFMTPFSLLRMPQFAAAASLGLLVVAVARLARRAARESEYAPRAVAAAGTLAALCTTFASTLLVNGGSRFGHVFAAALLAWGVEAICAVVNASRPGTPRSQLTWSIALGTCIALLPATRPGDGTASATGLGLYGLYALVRRRASLRAVAGTAAATTFFGALTLVILRLQLGTWFKTGYSLGPVIYPWNKMAFSWPQPGDWRWGIPLATGSYCWWPLSPAVGVAGLVMLRGQARRIAFMLGVGAIALFWLCSLLEMGRGFDWGYGPRYALPTVVPMAVGTGVALAPLWVRARKAFARSAMMAAGPFTLAALAIVLGVFRLVPLVYPNNTASVRSLNALNAEIRRQRIHNALVLLPSGIGWMNDGLDMTMNLPLTLYPDQDVVIAMDKSPILTQCVREHYSGRTFYTAFPGTTIQLKRD
jgi:hypothetical protein